MSDTNEVFTWIVYRNTNGTYNSLGVNEHGQVPQHARPLHPDFQTLQEALTHFNKGYFVPLVMLTEEEENMLFFDHYPTEYGGYQTGNRDVWGVWGQKYLLKKVHDGECTWYKVGMEEEV